MTSIADDLRREARATKGEPAEARLEKALRLGDSDVALHAAGTGLADSAVRGMLERQRARGRRPSACANR